MDKNIDILIRKCFESLNRKAPKELWRKISGRLEHESETAPVDNSIKDSFDSIQKKAPGNIWGNISDKLETEQRDRPFHEKVKDSFDALESHAPEESWNRIKKQLIIDRTWRRINNQLNMRDIYRMMRYAAVILLLLTLGYNRLDDFSRINTIEIDEVATLSGGKVKETQKPQLVKRTEIENAPVINNDNDISRGEHPMPVTKPMNNNPVIKQERSDGGGADVGKSTTEYSVSEPDRLLAVSTVVGLESSTVQPVIQNMDEFIAETENQTEVNASFQRNALFNMDALELGLTFAYERTIINNNENRLGMDQGSLTRTYQDYEKVFAVAVNYNFDKKSVISTALYLNNKEKQSLSKFEQGNLSNKKLNLTYLKVDLIYQRNFTGNQSLPVHPILGVGGYYSHLKSARETVNKVSETKNNEFSDHDYGFQAIAGLRSETARFIMEYGIKAEYGLTNIYTGNEMINAEFNYTNIINYGAFLSFKIKL